MCTDAETPTFPLEYRGTTVAYPGFKVGVERFV